MAMQTHVLIIGAGPAGATLALLLVKHHGIKSIVICRHTGTANTPRAHIFNQRAMEVMRDLGLEGHLSTLASSASNMAHTSWLHSLTGQEYGRLWSWGNDPARKGIYESCSPCAMSDLPQSYLEPVLVEAGKKLGVEYRFHTEFVSLEQIDGGVRTALRDRGSGKEFQVVSEYLIGADGARSNVLDQLGIPIEGRQLNTAFNVHIKADLTRYFEHRPGILNWILNPDAPDWSAVGNFRMVRPWNEFVVSMHPSSRDGKPFEPTNEDIKRRLYQMIGEEKVPIEILSTYRWTINDQVALSWQKGRVVCIGDATHRHPPINGLGSNTCISDAFNLAWKLAFVLKGWASPALVETLTSERQPVGKSIVRRANEGMEAHRELWSLIGLTANEREKAVNILESVGERGETFRARFRSALERVDDEVQAVGIQMNQCYIDSPATKAELTDTVPNFSNFNPLKDVMISTHPGCHLPHVWLARDGQSHRVSTLDLAGHGKMTLFTGIGGSPWLAAVKALNGKCGLVLKAHSIGYGCEYMDAYRDWNKVKGVTEDGVVLVRPDHFVAWRCDGIASGHQERLEEAIRYCLGLPT